MSKFLEKYRVIEVLTPCLIFGLMTPGIVGLSKSANQPEIVVVFLIVLYATIPINFIWIFRTKIWKRLRR